MTGYQPGNLGIEEDEMDINPNATQESSNLVYTSEEEQAGIAESENSSDEEVALGYEQHHLFRCQPLICNSRKRQCSVGEKTTMVRQTGVHEYKGKDFADILRPHPAPKAEIPVSTDHCKRYM